MSVLVWIAAAAGTPDSLSWTKKHCSEAPDSCIRILYFMLEKDLLSRSSLVPFDALHQASSLFWECVKSYTRKSNSASKNMPVILLGESQLVSLRGSVPADVWFTHGQSCSCLFWDCVKLMALAFCGPSCGTGTKLCTLWTLYIFTVQSCPGINLLFSK